MPPRSRAGSRRARAALLRRARRARRQARRHLTVADREAELLIRERIAARIAEHAVLGEDTARPTRARACAGSWTRSMRRARSCTACPFFGVLIGIDVDGETVVGVSHFPALQETVAAGKGLGCTWNGARLPRLEGGPDRRRAGAHHRRRARAGSPEGAGYRRLQKRARFARTWGDCYGHALVATGRAEVMVDPVMKSWDAGPS